VRPGWRVERDGSSDFTSIQPAIEAAAEGDTILIGPGRYDEFFEVQTPGWTEPVVVWVNKDNLTIIGADPEQTIIGPEEYYAPLEAPLGTEQQTRGR
jgi:pectin methylesterase-like acyl-CoA thioesterase